MSSHGTMRQVRIMCVQDDCVPTWPIHMYMYMCMYMYNRLHKCAKAVVWVIVCNPRCNFYFLVLLDVEERSHVDMWWWLLLSNSRLHGVYICTCYELSRYACSRKESADRWTRWTTLGCRWVIMVALQTVLCMCQVLIGVCAPHYVCLGNVECWDS